MKILLIEDDAQLNSTISIFLKRMQHEMVSIDDGDIAIDLIDQEKFDLYIIDINLPNISGLDIVKYIRQKDSTTPVIMITASLELENFKKAFNNGCNEYIKKPFYLEELKIRIENILSKKISDENIVRISNNITYDKEYEELIVNGEIKKLRKKERRLMNLLLENTNQIVSLEKIYYYVWENEIRESYPLQQLIYALKKYFDYPEKYIISHKGIGYELQTNL
jgi:DNA-binding response OmpR family regulator